MLLASSMLISCSDKMAFADYPVYEGDDLGLQYQNNQSSFRVWAPTAEVVELLLYRAANGGEASERIAMQKAEKGTWLSKVEKDLNGWYYVYRAKVDGQWMKEVPDPYAFAVGMNGKRSAIIDLDRAAPANWEKDLAPEGLHPVDALVYELHVRDASIHSTSGITAKGKFLGLAETGTVNAAGLSTGIDHIRELGATHVHLLPFYDFLSIDESKPETPQYNWGYEPLNYNVPEGSYSSDASDPSARIRELRELVMRFHQNGLRLVMDVVYNHTMLTQDSWFNQLVPGYYYRQNEQGEFSNATACGNEIASERPMVRKFILESLEFWMKNYHVDGFRFDLMGVHDIVTMQEIERRLKAINPHVLLYGEGWAAGESPLPEKERALKKYATQLNGIAVFSDDIRDGIKGSVFEEEDRGFVSGKPGMEPSIRFGVVASCPHPQVNYQKVNYSDTPYARDPGQVVTYAECHDNHVLWDKLAISAKYRSEAERIAMHKLALGIVLTSQGIPFLHAGTEFLRSKQGNENSYNAGDSINAIDWSLKTKNQQVFEYVRALIALRKAHPAFRMRTGEAIRNGIQFLDSKPGTVAYTLNGAAHADDWKKILVIYNASPESREFPIPSGKWVHHSLPGQGQIRPSASQKVWLPGIGLYLFYAME